MSEPTVENVEYHILCRLELDLRFMFAKAVIADINLTVLSHCYGCEINHPSQREHTCIMLSDEERLDWYGHETLENLDKK